ncbi:hypothetical protein QFZ76_007529 [Streptomyces sp. V4I2]|nr:hypothetical protein [Streptomyces sp. V4I2]
MSGIPPTRYGRLGAPSADHEPGLTEPHAVRPPEDGR